MDTGDSPDWSMLVVATDVITALDLRGWDACLDDASTDALAEIRLADEPRWGFVVGRCGWSTYLDTPTPGDPWLSIAVPGRIDAFDADAAPSIVAQEIIRQLADDTAPASAEAPPRIDRPRRRSRPLRTQGSCATRLHTTGAHPAGRRLRAVDAGTFARVIPIERRGHGD